MISSCSFLSVSRHWKVITFTVGDSLTTSDSNSSFISLKTMIHTLPVAVTYLLYMLATVESIRGVNVPMYTTLWGAADYNGIYNDCGGVISVGLVVLGAFTARAQDLSFDFYGYGVVFLANIATTAYLATIARIGSIALVFLFKNFFNLISTALASHLS
ncbi:hypothetical protein Dsin_026897 [Dipteronia sinensis]|uniref:Uncharacterized protein n=1 Tax=Dipteronia sinensis TaxID=43782 RepID=A0AAE0DYB2_9ROSI|nr:hypothetical protein Dsin_026897 [Dipteronia sinensis]